MIHPGQHIHHFYKACSELSPGICHILSVSQCNVQGTMLQRQAHCPQQGADTTTLKQTQHSCNTAAVCCSVSRPGKQTKPARGVLLLPTPAPRRTPAPRSGTALQNRHAILQAYLPTSQPQSATALSYQSVNGCEYLRKSPNCAQQQHVPPVRTADNACCRDVCVFCPCLQAWNTHSASPSATQCPIPNVTPLTPVTQHN
jgi:hypothetical protein